MHKLSLVPSRAPSHIDLTNHFVVSVTLVLLLLLFPACRDEEPIRPGVSANAIMPLGASRVEGARPDFESYRYELWKLLTDGDYDFDFIGTQEDEAAYPEYNGLMFDRDHEGFGGYTSGQILANLQGKLSADNAPDIVLFSSPGGNDALQNLSYQEALANVNEVIDLLQQANKEVTIILEQLAPARSDIMTPQLADFFNRMQQDVVTIAQEESTPSSNIIVVDMAAGFSDAYLADDVHYNEAGAEFIAERYFSVLESILR